MYIWYLYVLSVLKMGYHDIPSPTKTRSLMLLTKYPALRRVRLLGCMEKEIVIIRGKVLSPCSYCCKDRISRVVKGASSSSNTPAQIPQLIKNIICERGRLMLKRRLPQSREVLRNTRVR